jgi:glyoxylase-like metal-dependent hydrolase (beta-lactamase superfamily II)
MPRRNSSTTSHAGIGVLSVESTITGTIQPVTASMQDKVQPAFFRAKLGAFEIISILDSKAVRGGLSQSHGGGAAAEDIGALARANQIDADRYEHPFIPALVNTGTELVLFDTGFGPLQRECDQLRGRVPDGLLVQRMTEAGYAAADVDVVVITHGHPDHIGGLMERGKRVFSNARYVFGAAEFDFWKRGENIREARKFNRELFLRLAVPLADRARFIMPGDEVASGIHAVDAAGHSPGMMAFLIESEGRRLLNLADTCGHYVVALQRPDLHLDVDDDKEKAAATRARILDMAAADELFVVGFHMPFPGIGYVERWNSSYRWVPHSYQLNL